MVTEVDPITTQEEDILTGMGTRTTTPLTTIITLEIIKVIVVVEEATTMVIPIINITGTPTTIIKIND